MLQERPINPDLIISHVPFADGLVPFELLLDLQVVKILRVVLATDRDDDFWRSEPYLFSLLSLFYNSVLLYLSQNLLSVLLLLELHFLASLSLLFVQSGLLFFLVTFLLTLLLLSHQLALHVELLVVVEDALVLSKPLSNVLEGELALLFPLIEQRLSLVPLIQIYFLLIELLLLLEPNLVLVKLVQPGLFYWLVLPFYHSHVVWFHLLQLCLFLLTILLLNLLQTEALKSHSLVSLFFLMQVEQMVLAVHTLEHLLEVTLLMFFIDGVLLVFKGNEPVKLLVVACLARPERLFALILLEKTDLIEMMGEDGPLLPGYIFFHLLEMGTFGKASREGVWGLTHFFHFTPHQTSSFTFVVIINMYFFVTLFPKLLWGQSPCAQLCASCSNQGTASQVCNTCSDFTQASFPCQCVSGFSTSSVNTCVLCHSTCLTCSGPDPAQCLTCTTGFTFNLNCIPPNMSSTPKTLLVEQKFTGYGFGVPSTWTATGTTNCGAYYIYGGYGQLGSGSSITATYTGLNALYQVRLIVSVFFIDAWGAADHLKVYYNSIQVGQLIYPGSTGSAHLCGAGASNQKQIMKNFDNTYSTSGTTLVFALTGSGGEYWGITNIYLLATFCDSSCATCSGATVSTCKTCADSVKMAVYPIGAASGTCKCTGSYFLSNGVCVTRCPSSPTSMYSDTSTRDCVASCPANTYAQDTDNSCATDCITSGPVLYKDMVNWRCVETCPSGYYKYSTNKTCVSACPSSFFASNVDYTCVSTCPNNATYVTFAYNLQCLTTCPSATFATSISPMVTPPICASSCADPYYQDTSLGYPRCINTCPYPNYFGQNTTGSGRGCLTQCLTGYGDIRPSANSGFRRCLAACPYDATATKQTYGLDADKRCYYTCPTGTWGNGDTFICVTSPTLCPTGKYGNNITNLCVLPADCPVGAFADPNNRYCVFVCPNITTVAWYGDSSTRTCTTSCSSGFGDGGINLCVATCFTLNTYADPNTGNTCVLNCAQPAGGVKWYADDYSRTCVTNCPYPGNSGAGTCSGCPSYFGDSTTFKCVTQCPSTWFASSSAANHVCTQTCPTDYFSDVSTGTGLCVAVCPIVPILFGNPNTNICVDICPIGNSFFGDPTVVSGSPTTSRRCVTGCPSGLYRDNTNTLRRCVATCNSTSWVNGARTDCITDPLLCGAGFFADNLTRMCVNTCPASDSTFGDPTSKMCLKLCPANTYADTLNNRQCMSGCLSPNFGNNNTRTCESRCLDYRSYGDDQDANRRCMAVCTFTPLKKFANDFNSLCVLPTACPTDYYGDNVTKTCVNNCPSPSFGDPGTRYCVSQCQGSLYGDDSTGYRLCKNNCPIVPNYYGDTDKICKATCVSPNFGDPDTIRLCLSGCRASWFSYEPTRHCLQNCPSTYFGDSTNRKCQPTAPQCPTGQYGDPSTNLCVQPCPTSPSLFGQNTSRTCVATCPTNQYSNPWMATRYCVQRCPSTPDVYGDNTTYSCVERCVQANTWADYQLRMCVFTCSATPISTFSQNNNYRCVTALTCPSSPQLTYGQTHSRTCIATCWFYPTWDNTVIQFADNSTRMCVNRCPANTYGTTFTNAPICVSICPPVPRQFGDDSTNLCVAECPSAQSTFGDQTGNRLCVTQCPIVSSENYYAQLNQRICVKVCQSGTWGRTSDRTCVLTPAGCNAVTQWAQSYTNMCVTTCPELYQEFADPTTYRCVTKCVANAAVTYYADLINRICVFSCSATSYGLFGTFGDNSTGMCVTGCIAPNTYGDTYNNRSCAATCSQATTLQFADPSSKLCVTVCPSFPSLYGDLTNFKCVSYDNCPASTYADDTTRQCKSVCPIAIWIQGKRCVARCPQGMYHYSSATFTGVGDNKCYSNCPTGFAEPIDNTCKSSCLPRYSEASICVDRCSTGKFALANGSCVIATSCSPLFGNALNTLCVSPCPAGLFQDPSTQTCVSLCPASSYGDTGVTPNACVAAGSCSGSLTADPQTRTCKAGCNAGYYMLNNVCGQTCSTNFADDSTRKCQPTCVQANTFADTSTRKCVTVCPANNYRTQTFTCATSCAGGYFADPSTMNCVSTCPSNPKLFGYTGNYTCLNPCIAGTYSSGTLCYLPANCPGSTWADDITKSCVTTCPNSTFADTSLKVCVSTCPTSTFADPASKKCQSTCTVAGYYSDTLTKSCVLVCPASQNTYGNTVNRQCVNPCPASTFGENATRTCVGTCPATTHSFGFQNTVDGTRLCLAICPLNFVANPSNRQCLSGCITSTPQLFADVNNRTCVANCPSGFYAELDSKTCLSSCASSATYPNSDPSTGKCVTNCPSTPLLFAHLNQCLAGCPSGFFALVGTSANICTGTCVGGAAETFANPLSRTCDSICPNGYYGDSILHVCDTVCATRYADNITRKCLPACDNTIGLFADPSNNKCATLCSGSRFADPNTGLCQTACTNGYFADSLTRTCVQTCPAFNRTYGSSGVCVASCPNNFYAQESTRLCSATCLSGTFKDSTTNRCVATCPVPALFGDNNGNICVSQLGCTLSTFSDPVSRQCQAQCPSIPPLFGDRATWKCVKTCPSNYYADNKTRQCVQTCPTNTAPYPYDTFGDRLTSLCVVLCPQSDGTFASDVGNRLCVPICPSTPDYYGNPLNRRCTTNCPTDYYADVNNANRMCVKQCMANNYRVNSTQRCVTTCPNNQFAIDPARICLDVCPEVPLKWGDTTLHACVDRCTTAPNLFADTVSRLCVSACPKINTTVWTYADSYSGICVQICPISQGYYADRSDPANPICTAVCPANYFKDNSTRLCVSNCPSFPLTYSVNLGAGIGGVCVYNCPTSFYGTSSLTCVSSCTAPLWSDPSTNLCVSRCPSKPFTYGDDLDSLRRCMSACSGGQFADNKTQTCLPGCPLADNTFGTTTFTCVTTCPAGFFAQSSTRLCITTCPNGKFADNYTVSCVSNCPNNTYADANSKKCLLNCPVSAFKHDATWTCIYPTLPNSNCPNLLFADTVTSKCLTTCSDGYYGLTSTKFCVQTCPNSFFANNLTRKCQSGCFSMPLLYANTLTHTCVSNCPSTPIPYFGQNSSLLCKLNCVGSGGFADPGTYRCQAICTLSGYFADPSTSNCVTRCPSGQNLFADPDSKTCVGTCPSGTYADTFSQSCVMVCPQSQNFYAQNASGLQTGSCVTTCRSGLFADQSTQTCVPVCPVVPSLFGDTSSGSGVCRTDCPPSANTYANSLNRLCDPVCPNGYFAQPISKRCMTYCPQSTNLYADTTRKACIPTCDQTPNTYADPLTMTCTFPCKVIPVKYFADNSTFACVRNCPANSYADDATGRCVITCQKAGLVKTYADNTNNKCVQTCSLGLYADNSTWTCVNLCTSGTFADPVSRRCVTGCPQNNFLFAQPSSRMCVLTCPGNLFADQTTRTCVPLCNQRTNLWAFANSNQCVDQCPPPYWGDLNTKLCVNNCPGNYYPDGVDRVCKICPNECTACNNPYLCTSCINGYRLFNGACTNFCVVNATVATYTYPFAMMCVTAINCPQGYYGNNDTASCSNSCPSKQYGNVTTGACTTCEATCSSCLNSTICTACETTAGMGADKMCYAYCSASPLIYFDLAGKCVKQCPTGSYVSVDGVTCQACSSICKSCQGTASNCLACSQSFMYNKTCISKCPTGFYGDAQLNCQSCEKSSVAACTQPLTFKTDVGQQNYQYFVMLDFNQPIDVQGDISKLFQVNMALKRALQEAVATLVNNGITYTVVKISASKYKLVLQTNADVVNPQFSVAVKNMSQIKGRNSGSTLQQAAATFSFPSIQYYNVTAAKSSTLNVASLIVSAVQVGVYFVMVWLSPKTFLFILYVLQTLNMLNYAAVSMPPSLFFFLKNLQLSHLSFLPNMFASGFNNVSLNKTYQKVIDLNTDSAFLRSEGYIIFIALVYLLAYGVFKLLSLQKLVKSRHLRQYCQAYLQSRFGYSILYQLTLPIYFRMAYFAMVQFTDTSISNGMVVFSLLTGTLSLLLMIVLPGLIARKIYRSEQPLLYLYYYKEMNWAVRWFPVMEYAKRFLISLFLVSLQSAPVPQAILISLVLVTDLIYWLFCRVMEKKMGFILTLFFKALLATYAVTMAAFGFVYKSFSSTNRELIGSIMSGILTGVLILLLVWQLARAYIDIAVMWKKFKLTDFYFQFIESDEAKLKKWQSSKEVQLIEREAEPTARAVQPQALYEIENIYRYMDDQGKLKIRLKKKKKVKKTYKRQKNDHFLAVHLLEEKQPQEPVLPDLAAQVKDLNPFLPVDPIRDQDMTEQNYGQLRSQKEESVRPESRPSEEELLSQRPESRMSSLTHVRRRKREPIQEFEIDQEIQIQQNILFPKADPPQDNLIADQDLEPIQLQEQSEEPAQPLREKDVWEQGEWLAGDEEKKEKKAVWQIFQQIQ